MSSSRRINDEAVKEKTGKPEGVAVWLGEGGPETLVEGEDYELSDGTTGEIRVVEPGSHVRMTWKPVNWDHPSTLQVRAMEASSGRGTISFHQEKVPDDRARQSMKAYWKEKLRELQEID